MKGCGILLATLVLSGCSTWTDSVTESFRNNLLVEDRYRMILDGLQVTLIITLFAAILGTLLGGLVCWMRMSRRAWLRQVARVYIDLMRGTPVLVLLMLMYYVVIEDIRPLAAVGRPVGPGRTRAARHGAHPARGHLSGHAAVQLHQFR